jgi:hypothetical protein
LSSIEAVPGTQIYTGQDGTSQIPSHAISDLDIPSSEQEGLDEVCVAVPIPSSLFSFVDLFSSP